MCEKFGKDMNNLTYTQELSRDEVGHVGKLG